LIAVPNKAYCGEGAKDNNDQNRIILIVELHAPEKLGL
jgi:hypothetical protein